MGGRVFVFDMRVALDEAAWRLFPRTSDDSRRAKIADFFKYDTCVGVNFLNQRRPCDPSTTVLHRNLAET
jgi:hypothetical protein